MQRLKVVMKEFLPVLKKTKLFSGLNEEEVLSALQCLNANVKTYLKNTLIFCDGDSAELVGVILSGEIQTQKTDYSGNLNIISRLFPAEIIAASACYSTDKRQPFDAVCAADSKLLCLDTSRLIQPCHSVCSFHTRLIQNMLNIIADRNILLAEKIDILTKRTIREKVLAYLFAQSKKAKSKKFSVPLSRRQMAEYLSVNRSALSRELSALRDDGLLDFDENSFCLKVLKKSDFSFFCY